MTQAIKATFATYDHIPSRGVLKLSLEVPLEEQERVFKVLGFPVHGESNWVAIAPLGKESATEKPVSSTAAAPAERPEGDNMRVRAVMLCKDKAFQAYCNAKDEAEAREYMLTFCEIDSRSELGWNHAARARFEIMHSKFMQRSGRMAEIRS